MSNHSTAVPPLRALWSASSRLERWVLASLFVAIAATSWYLLPFWRESPELSHGFLAPIFVLGMLWQSRREPSFAIAGYATGFLLQSCVVIGGIVIAGIAVLAVLIQGPLHSQTAFLVGIATSAFILSGVLALSRSPSGWVHLNSASLSAAVLWWLVAPLPSGTLARVSLFLQHLVTTASVKTLVTLGCAAVQHGNIIQLPHALIGVEEACSGIRSLTACLFAGVVFGCAMLQGLPRRLAVVLGAGVLAVIMNFLRSLTLCLLVAGGIEIHSFWHNAIGYAVLGVTTVALFFGCLALKPAVSIKGNQQKEESRKSGTGALLVVHAIYAGVVLLLVILAVDKVWPADTHERTPPDLQSLMAIDDLGWQHRTDDTLASFGPQLNTSCLRQEIYARGNIQVTFYVAYWSSGQSTLGSVALHTPDMCLPGGGWISQPTPPPAGHYPLPSPRRFAFVMGTYPQHVWFWHYFDNRLINSSAGLYPWQLAPAVLRRGIRVRAPQWVIRVSSNLPLETLVNEPLLREFFARLHAAGLAGDAEDDRTSRRAS
jgi:exosortase